jgi:excisionase family DNA binding protein
MEAQLAEVWRVARASFGREGDPDSGVVGFNHTAELLDVSSRTVHRLVRSGQLATVSIGSAPRIPLSEIRRVTAGIASRPEFGQVRKTPRQRQLDAMSEAQKIRALAKKR